VHAHLLHSADSQRFVMMTIMWPIWRHNNAILLSLHEVSAQTTQTLKPIAPSFKLVTYDVSSKLRFTAGLTCRTLLRPRPHSWRIMHWWPVHCLSVRVSVPCLTLRRERKGIGSWKLARWKPVIWVIRDPIQSSKGQRSRSPGRLTPW